MNPATAQRNARWQRYLADLEAYAAAPQALVSAGWREIVLQILLHNLSGVEEGVANLIGSLSFLIILICSLPGGVIYFFYKPSGASGHVKLSEMQREVADLEHEITAEQ